MYIKSNADNPHGGVRVIYREGLIPKAGKAADEPDFLPAKVVLSPDGRTATMVTDPDGHIFMDKYPNLSIAPAIEPWGKFSSKQDAEGAIQPHPPTLPPTNRPDTPSGWVGVCLSRT